MAHWTDTDWPDRMLALLARSGPQEPAVPRRGSLWTSVSTGRRGAVLWACGGSVCLNYDETNILDSVIHPTEAFLRLYQPVE